MLRRLGEDCPAWVIDPLLDAFEPAAVAAIHGNAKKADKNKGKRDERGA